MSFIDQMIYENRRNLLKVKNESMDVQSLLKTGVAYSKASPNIYSVVNSKRTHKMDLSEDIDNRVEHLSRVELLETAIILGTSVNKEAQEELIKHVSNTLGQISDKDYDYIAHILATHPDREKVDKVNKFLIKHLKGFYEKYIHMYSYYYGI